MLSRIVYFIVALEQILLIFLLYYLKWKELLEEYSFSKHFFFFFLIDSFNFCFRVSWRFLYISFSLVIGGDSQIGVERKVKFWYREGEFPISKQLNFENLEGARFNFVEWISCAKNLFSSWYWNHCSSQELEKKIYLNIVFHTVGAFSNTYLKFTIRF